MKPPSLTIVVGPTASGKSDLAMQLAQRSGGEIVSADSVQIYRHFDIGSAKPSKEEQQCVPHHLVDLLDAQQPADVSQFVDLADQCIADIHERGKAAIICGGSFLWVKALLFGLAKAPAGDPKIRERHKLEAETLGRAHLHERLAKVDPISYQKLAPNDLVRVSRALEVFELCGRPLSEIQAEHGFRNPRYPATLIGLSRTRAELHERIARRTSIMFEQGLVEEVKALRDRGYADSRAMRSVGYRQVSDALASTTPFDTSAVRESVAQATRGFVRNQTTWLRGQPVKWVSGLAEV